MRRRSSGPDNDDVTKEIERACRRHRLPEHVQRGLVALVPVLQGLLNLPDESSRLLQVRGPSATKVARRSLRRAERDFDRVLASFRALQPALKAELARNPTGLSALLAAEARLQEAREHLGYKWAWLTMMALPAPRGERKDVGRTRLLNFLAVYLRMNGHRATTTKTGLFASVASVLLGDVAIRHDDLKAAQRFADATE